MRKYEENTLSEEVKKLDITLRKLVRQRSLPYTFLSAIVTAVGSLVGASIILGILGYFLSKLNFMPFVRFLQEYLPKR